jgi:galactokinase
MKNLIKAIESPENRAAFEKVYGPAWKEALERYSRLARRLLQDFPEAAGEDVRLFSAPGRTELGGNHTDHNNGKVLAASVQLDTAALAFKSPGRHVLFRSIAGRQTKGYPDAELDLEDLKPHKEEEGKTTALIRGIAAGMKKRHEAPGGFVALSDSDVPGGSGLSSSASVEALIGKIFDCLYNNGRLSALEIAKMGQEAENKFFGKPCGLMDQIATVSGGTVAIDFKDPAEPKITHINFDPARFACSLCIVRSGGSHADLSEDYAAVPSEMKAVASFLGHKVLRECEQKDIIENMAGLRKKLGDRAVLRSLHFFAENKRVDAMVSALKSGNREAFLGSVNASGNSSAKLLQNIYSPAHPREQSLGLALALTRSFLFHKCGGKGALRVHGGGFAGTIQAYIPSEHFSLYKKRMEGIFGEGAVTELSIRPVGATEIKLK